MNDLCDNLKEILITISIVFGILIIFSGLLIFGVGQTTASDFKNLVTIAYIAVIILTATITLGILTMTVIKIKGLITKLGEIK